MNEKLILASMQKILHDIEEGIHIVDAEGVTRVYNKAMEKIEGLGRAQTIGKHLLDVFPNWTIENSTLLTVLKTGKPLQLQKQSYMNLRGQEISTVNTTYPIILNEKIIGAVEIASNTTKVEHMSSTILELQQKLLNPVAHSEEGLNSYTFESLIGQDKTFLNAIKLAKTAAKSSSSVMIFGETGTGKELFAQSIHNESSRSGQPFIAQNCAALPDNLLEGILFGTSKGGFTGAVDRPGLFEQAHGGTLFLDEINSMDPSLQVKLLRVLQESYVRRVGGLDDVPVDVRIIAASNEFPKELLNSNNFRNDLFYRINVITIQIPPLRSRPDDVKLLANYFIDEFNEKLGKDVWMMSEDLLDHFENYPWRGNIRELRNFIETAMNLVADEHVLGKEHLPVYYDELLDFSHGIDQTTKVDLSEGLNPYLESLERKLLEQEFLLQDKNITKTADILKLSRQNLQYKLKKFDLL
ncbi:PAS domain-containing protein [Acidaminobacter sp. JC074]|uniref:sigma-54 interaction domain-containing protein n=1 Tax=Acidaminobacter sp. JC074 TaxID=2530199 RepID=UPI001F0D022F|nr:sigma 54-interacting transcriptional regulator [Acidaminobacter sp. JC074]MCH4888239.1 PAS domain-containing protein [Acidaminobacter sp. JC074]